MSLAIFKPSRCVLLIGDEALYVYNVSPRGAKLVDSVPWAAEDFVDIVATLIRRECGGKPVLMLNDMTDQHFKGGQRLPKVGPMDRANVLQRRLVVAFPNFPIRGALPIKDTPRPKSDSARPVRAGGGLYLFAAVPMSEPIQKTVSAVKHSMASIAGFALLPVEASDMVSTLAAKVAGKERKPSKWAVFIGQHQNGTLRQVITRDGQLAMTRMTPISDKETDPQVWANEVAQEFKATVSYLSRFGYSPEDGTDVFVIAEDRAGMALEQQITIPCNYASFTAQEAARTIGITIGFQEDERYADALHAAWIGRKTKFILPMDATELSSIHRPRQAVAAAMFLLFCSAGYLAWMTMGQAQTMFENSDNLSVQQRNLRQIEGEYEAEVARMESLGFDVKLVQGSINAYEHYEDTGLNPLPLLKRIREALGDELRVENLRMTRHMPVESRNGRPEYDAQGNEIIPKPTLSATMRLVFPPTIAPEEGVRQVNSLQRRLQQAFPDQAVSIDKQVADMSYDENFSGTAGGAPQGAGQGAEDYFAILRIEGDLP